MWNDIEAGYKALSADQEELMSYNTQSTEEQLAEIDIELQNVNRQIAKHSSNKLLTKQQSCLLQCLYAKRDSLLQSQSNTMRCLVDKKSTMCDLKMYKTNKSHLRNMAGLYSLSGITRHSIRHQNKKLMNYEKKTERMETLLEGTESVANIIDEKYENRIERRGGLYDDDDLIKAVEDLPMVQNVDEFNSIDDTKNSINMPGSK